MTASAPALRTCGRLARTWAASAALACMAYASHAANLPTYDGFANYSPGYDLGTQYSTNGDTTTFAWVHVGIDTNSTTMTVASGSLSYPGLASSAGNSITNAPGPTQGLRYQSRNVNVYSGSGVFYSALFNLSSLGTLGTAGQYIMSLNNTSTTNQNNYPTTIPARTWVRKSPNDSTKFNVGVSYGNGTVTPTWDAADRAVGSTVMVVARYIDSGGAGNSNAVMWVNPAPSDLGAGSAPGGSITNTSGSNPTAVIQSLIVQNQFSTTPPYTIDEVRIGTTWADVTPVGPPGFTLQPSNVTTDYGTAANFSASAAAGSTSITYSWRKGAGPALSDGPTGTGSTISGSGTANLTITSVSQADEGTYTATASNGNGSTDSSGATLAVNDPKITSQPAVSNPTPLPGATVSFTNAAAIGTPTLVYRWQKNGTDVSDGTFGGATISGSGTATLTIAGVRAGGAGDSGSYVLRVTNGLDRAVGTIPVVLTVADPVFVSNPASAAKNFNESVTFTATISGTAPNFTYQWKKDGVNINNGGLGGRAVVSPVGASANTTTTLTINNLIASDAANSAGYTVTVTDNNSSTATSAAATLSVTDPVITTPVANVATNAGATARLKVTAAGSGTLAYTWKTNGVPVANGLTPWGSTISGADTDTLLIADVTATDAKTYTAEVSGAGVAQSSSGSLSVAQITRQPTPAALTVVAGNRTVFSVAASLAGPGSLTYQWIRNNGSSYAGQTSSTFRIDNTQASDADSGIRVKVFYDGTDFILSSPVSLSVSSDTRLRGVNLVVLRAGDGSQSLVAGGSLPASIYLDQFDTSGNYVSTISVPDSGTDAAVTTENIASLPSSSGLNGTSLQRSADGRYLVFSCYNTNVSFASSLASATPASVPRCAGVLGPLGEYSLFKDTATFSGNTYRAASFDGTNNFWEAGATASTGNVINGVFYAGSSSPSSTAISTAANMGAANVRYAAFFKVNGQDRLYFDGANVPPGLYHIDGFPTAGGNSVTTDLTLAQNAGGTGAPGPCGFAVSPDGNTIYVADGRGWSATVANTTGGIQKWTNGVLDKVLNADPINNVGTMYLTADFSANPVVIYAVTTAFNSTMDQNKVVKVVDDGSDAGVATVLATSGPNECYRGIAFGPVVPPHIDAVTPLPAGNYRVTVSGWSNIAYTVEASSGLAPASWTPLVTNSSPTGTFNYDDLTAGGSAHRFYRARYTP